MMELFMTMIGVILIFIGIVLIIGGTLEGEILAVVGGLFMLFLSYIAFDVSCNTKYFEQTQSEIKVKDGNTGITLIVKDPTGKFSEGDRVWLSKDRKSVSLDSTGIKAIVLNN